MNERNRQRLMLKWNIETLHNYNILTTEEYEKIYDRVNNTYPKK